MRSVSAVTNLPVYCAAIYRSSIHEECSCEGGRYHCRLVREPSNAGNIYLGIWPEGDPSGWPRELPPMFDIVDGEREYVAYYEPL